MYGSWGYKNVLTVSTFQKLSLDSMEWQESTEVMGDQERAFHPHCLGPTSFLKEGVSLLHLGGQIWIAGLDQLWERERVPERGRSLCKTQEWASCFSDNSKDTQWLKGFVFCFSCTNLVIIRFSNNSQSRWKNWSGHKKKRYRNDCLK